MLAAIEDKDVVVPVYADAADFLECPAGREFCPVLYWFVGVCAAANGSHARAPLFVASRKACHEAKGWASIGCRLCSAFRGQSGHQPAIAGQLRFYEYTPFCNGPGDVKSPRVIVTPPSSRFCPWSTLRPPHYAVRGSDEPI